MAKVKCGLAGATMGTMCACLTILLIYFQYAYPVILQPAGFANDMVDGQEKATMAVHNTRGSNVAYNAR